ncbi:hypothetical protein [Calidifontibacter indicus]|uniref:Uncharacterized protein n=1 Tax=Calidifontibacter indicus TaxID=419650 RepID=A0A3D9V0C9_9MICO|nr:hypothetical protein [Calidifontibacter indicus]REF31674.1 hypothetical protein DFJ65_2747 [Calidifontibacter indicus]
MQTSATRRIVPLLLAPMLLSLGLIGVGFGAAPPAHAGLCTTSPLDGTWYNSDSATQSITRTRVYCGDDTQTVCNGNICSTTYGVARYVQLWGKCYPTDCAWGSRKLTLRSDGWSTAFYDQGFATRTVWVRTESWYGRTYLRVSIWNDYRDSRTDKWTTDWFLR